jgi:alpha-L-rhamnosidase
MFPLRAPRRSTRSRCLVWSVVLPVWALGCGESGNKLPAGASTSAGTASAGDAGSAVANGGSVSGQGGGGIGGSNPTAGGSGTAGAADPGSQAPTGLLCELLRHPERTLISDAEPELGFITSAVRQSAYQILVASSSAALDMDQGDAWDSGKKASDQSINIQYAGSPLEPDKSYWWKVKTWDAADVASPWSEVQKFTMAASLGYGTAREPVEQTLIPPVEVTTLAPDHVFVDFGRHAFGWLELELDAPTAATVTVRLGERATGSEIELDAGGTSIRAASVQLQLQPGLRKYRVETPRDERNTSGEAIRLPVELGVVLPFRYVEVVGSPVAIEAGMLRQVAVHYPYEEAASAFTSSDEKLDQVWEISKYSMVAPTFAGVYIDGDRERIPYEGDAYIQQLGHYGVDREFALARYSHEYLLEHPTWPTEWKQHSVMMAWADWMYTGDTEALANAYDTLVGEKTLESHVGSDGLLNTGSLDCPPHTPDCDLVDWPEAERDGHVMQDVNTVVNAFFCRNLQQMADIARALGKQSEAERYDEMAAKALAAFNQQLIDSSSGLYVDGVGTSHSSLHSNMLPLAFGLVPAERRSSVVEFVKSRGMACSVYGAQYLLEGLYQAGEATAALQLMTSESDRGWLHMIDLGATITLEAWDAKYKPNLDWNHAWGGAPANILPRFVLGVTPLTPGFGVAQIRPQPGSLTQVEGTVPTIRGPIKVAWKHQPGESPTLAVSLPGNTQADVQLPSALAACAPLLDGTPAELTVEDGASWLKAVAAGNHELSCP